MSKKKIVTSVIILLLLAAAGVIVWNCRFYFIGTSSDPVRAKENEDFGIEDFHSSVDKDGDGIDDQTDILQGARDYISTNPVYKSKYYSTGYPDDKYGVCTDVVANAMKSAGYDLMELVNADILADPEDKTAKVVVPDYQLSLAIGKEGQNARLAARLTGFKIDIKSETQAREIEGWLDVDEDDEYYDDYEEYKESQAQDEEYADDYADGEYAEEEYADDGAYDGDEAAYEEQDPEEE